MAAGRFKKSYNHWSRTVLLRGSPAYKWSIWLSGIAIGLIWIGMNELSSPEDAKLFVNPKRQVSMTDQEINDWNKKLIGGSLLKDIQYQHIDNSKHMDIDSQREKLLGQIKLEK